MSAIENSHSLSNRLTELLEHNRSMLKNAEAGQWDRVIEADILRQEMLDTLYSSADIQNVPDVTSATREMLAINQEIEKLATEARQASETEAFSINKGRRAVSVYGKHTR